MTNKMADTGGGSANDSLFEPAQILVDRMRQDAERLLTLDAEAFVRWFHEFSVRARDVETTFVGDKHPFAKSAGLFKNDPDWSKYKAAMTRFRSEDADNN